MQRFGPARASALLFLLLTCCDRRTAPERALDDYWHAYADLNIAFERLKRSDPARAAQLRGPCVAQHGPDHYDDLMGCISSRWNPPNASGSTQLTRAEYEFVMAQSDFSHALTPLLATDPAKAGRLRALCEAERSPEHMHNCIAERWNG